MQRVRVSEIVSERAATRQAPAPRAPQRFQSSLALLAQSLAPALQPAPSAHVPLPERPSGYALYPRSSKPVRQAVAYTDEQKAIIADRSPILVANAFAGTGKTTTAVGYADARRDARILYMAFNKGIQTEAQARFGANTKCQTTHSLAFQAVGKHYADRISRSWRAMTVGKEAGLGTWRQAAIAHSILNKFFQSTEAEIGLGHGEAAQAQYECEEADLIDAWRAARALWVRMQDKADKVSIPDDAYLKMWALSRPQLDYDCIIFDEAQDSNPVTAQIIRDQARSTLLYIGDRHQSIYGFRGAVSAMDDFGPRATHLHLSRTWRFGPTTAGYANLLLGELKGEKVPLVGMGRDEPYKSGACVTKLSRTNAQLFKDAALVHGHGVHWIGGIEGYQVNRVMDAYALYTKARDQIRDPFIRNFASWGEMRAYTDETKDSETRILAELVEEYKHETPELVREMRANAVPDARNAQMVLSTAHKSKGLDWDYVQIADDFEVLEDAEASLKDDPTAPLNEQEINLLYVSITRARKSVQLNAETRAWIDDLPRHRKERQIALQKYESGARERGQTSRH